MPIAWRTGAGERVRVRRGDSIVDHRAGPLTSARRVHQLTLLAHVGRFNRRAAITAAAEKGAI
jgi:hypothetical protein